MRRKFFKSFFAVTIVAAVGVSSYKAYESYTVANMNESDMLIAENASALSQSESVQLYTRITNNCEYSWTGKKNSVISATIGNQVISVSIGSDGTGSYTVSNGEVRCIGGGNELCIPQNCPVKL